MLNKKIRIIKNLDVEKTSKAKIFLRKSESIWVMAVISILLLMGCGLREKEENDKETPRQAISYAMESLKELDMKAFNECTDNYVSTQYNWIGIPVRKEFKVFSELLQPGAKGETRYKVNYKLAEKIVENMTWEVKDVRQEEEKAEIDIEISNIDMQKVMGEYEIYILENMLESKGSGMKQLLKNMSDLANGKEDLIKIIDMIGTDYICTMEVTVFAYEKDGKWEIHLSDEFINAFMGNMMAEKYSGDVEQKINELTEKYEQKMEKWGENIAEDVENWVRNFEN